MKYFLYIICFFFCEFSYSQGVSNLWLLGYTGGLDAYTTSTKAKIDFQTGTPNVIPNFSKMRFTTTQGNISDTNGNMLMCSNGIWIANASGDTMMNGSGLNPGAFADNHNIYGSTIPNGNIFLTWPGDTTKYALFHITGNYNSNPTICATELFYSIIDMTLDSGFGGVTLKNQIVFQDTLSWGISACKHANGRDWWIVAIKDNSNTLYKVLLTPSGIASVTSQVFADTISYLGSANQPIFSSDGSKLAFLTGYYSASYFVTLVSYFDFDRCTGIFNNHQMINVSDGNLGFGTMFSFNSRYLYASTVRHIYQIDTDSPSFNVDTIAVFDGYYFPSPGFNTDFWLMYLAFDKKIYITSGSGVLDLNCIESPDSAGVACNLQQHSLHLPCYHGRSVPNHPNYFLGADSTTICDSLTSGIIKNTELKIQSLSISPNPATTVITINAINVKGKKASLIIYNSVGEIIGKRKAAVYNGGYVTQDVYIKDLPNGIYIVQLQTEKEVFTGKFLKEQF